MTPNNKGNWRSLLYVPASVPRFIEKAAKRGADAIILDLEDSVPASSKKMARESLNANAMALRDEGVEVLVRINQPLSLAVDDLKEAVSPAVSAIMIPKVEGASHLRLLDKLVEDLERQRGMVVGHTKFVLIIEDIHAYLGMEKIFTASPRNVAALLGSEDFAACAGLSTDPAVLAGPKLNLVLTARACGLTPLGLLGSVGATSNDDYETLAKESRKFGFRGATCIHPDQVGKLNSAFSPSAEERDWAERAISAYRDALAKGEGAAMVDGHMVDKPVVARAEAVLRMSGT